MSSCGREARSCDLQVERTFDGWLGVHCWWLSSPPWPAADLHVWKRTDSGRGSWGSVWTNAKCPHQMSSFSDSFLVLYRSFFFFFFFYASKTECPQGTQWLFYWTPCIRGGCISGAKFATTEKGDVNCSFPLVQLLCSILSSSPVLLVLSDFGSSVFCPFTQHVRKHVHGILQSVCVCVCVCVCTRVGFNFVWVNENINRECFSFQFVCVCVCVCVCVFMTDMIFIFIPPYPRSAGQ